MRQLHSDNDGLAVAMETSRPSDTGRITAVAFRALGELAGAHADVLWRLGPESGSRRRDHPHAHTTAVPCLSCAVHGCSPVPGLLLADMYFHRNLDEDWNVEVTTARTVASRVSRVPPCGEYLAEQYGTYWFDVIDFAMDLSDMTHNQLALYLRTLPPSPLAAVDDPARHLRVERLLSAALRSVPRFRSRILPILVAEALRRAEGSQQGATPVRLSETIPLVAAGGRLPATPGPLRRTPAASTAARGA